MHVFLSFFGWPAGSTWSNVLAMPSCGVLATVFAVVFRDKIGRAARDWHRRHFGHHDELGKIHERLDAHADLLDPSTPGGLAPILTELRDLKATVEATAAGIETLASIAKPTVRRGATPMRKTAAGKPGSEGGPS